MMNTKAFIGKIPEIAHLNKNAQEALLEKARYEACVVQGKSAKLAGYMVACLLLHFLVSLVIVFSFNFSSMVNALLIGFGAVASGFLYHYLSKKVLVSGLYSVLSAKMHSA